MITEGFTIPFEDEDDMIDAWGEVEVNDTVENFAATEGGFEMLHESTRKPDLVHSEPFTMTINGTPVVAEAFGGTHPPIPTRPRDPKW